MSEPTIIGDATTTTNNSTTGAFVPPPMTPSSSWMTDQRNRRQNNNRQRGYGRRYSSSGVAGLGLGGGGSSSIGSSGSSIHGTATRNPRRRETTVSAAAAANAVAHGGGVGIGGGTASTTLDFGDDDDDDGNDNNPTEPLSLSNHCFLPSNSSSNSSSSTVKAQRGGGGRPPRRGGGRLPQRPPPHHSSSSSSNSRSSTGGDGLDLIEDDFELWSSYRKPTKKNRPNNNPTQQQQQQQQRHHNLPRCPSSSSSRGSTSTRRNATSSSSSSSAFKFATPAATAATTSNTTTTATASSSSSLIDASLLDYFDSEVSSTTTTTTTNTDRFMLDTPVTTTDTTTPANSSSRQRQQQHTHCQKRNSNNNNMMSSFQSSSASKIIPPPPFTMEENVHPNDSSSSQNSTINSGSLVKQPNNGAGGARRSSRIIGQLKAREKNKEEEERAMATNNGGGGSSIAGSGLLVPSSTTLSSSSLSSSFPMNHTTHKCNNSKKRSATEPTNPTTPWEPLHPHSNSMVTTTMSSYSSSSSNLLSRSTPSSIGSSFSSIGNNHYSRRSESFSALAQRSHNTASPSWAMMASNSNTTTSSSSSNDGAGGGSGTSSGFLHQSLEKQRCNSMANIQDSNYGVLFSGATSCTTTTAASMNSPALQTPAGSSNNNNFHHCHRSISCGNVLSEMKFTTSNYHHHSPSLLASSPEMVLQSLHQHHQQQQLQGGGGGTTLSTPTAGGGGSSSSAASSSRKRRSMDLYTSCSPLLDEFELIGGTGGGIGDSYYYEQRTRSRKSSPSSYEEEGIVGGGGGGGAAATTLSLKMPTSASSVEPAVLPITFFSSPPPLPFMATIATSVAAFGCNETTTTMPVDKALEDVRDKLNDVSMMSTNDEDDDDDEHSTKTTSSTDECDNADDDEEEENTPREMTDVEIFECKSSYDDLKWLIKSLQKCMPQSSSASSSLQGGKKVAVASMGLNNGCVIALPPQWTFEHRATFSKWVAISFGFRVGNVGGGAGGSFLRCSDAEGRAVLDRLLRILNDYKNNRLVLSTTTSSTTTEGIKNVHDAKDVKPKARLSIKLSSARPACFRDGPSPFCDGLVEDLLTDDMKGITLDERKPLKNSSQGNNSVHQFIRSMNLQPLANKIKNTTLPCFRSPVGENHNSGRRSGGTRRLLRLSSESAINGTDFSNQLHGIGSPSPVPNRSFPGKRIREHASRALHPPRRPSLQKIRSSFERPNHRQQQQPDCLKLFESPHPRNTNLAPSACMENGLETPMPKHVEHWGSRPIHGKDWGVSTCCCDGTIDACSRIFAKSWITSEFCDSEELSSEYHISLNEEETSWLISIYDSDLNFDHEDSDSEIARINTGENSLKPMSKRIAFSRCDSVGASAFDLLHLDDEKQIDVGKPRGLNRRQNMKLRKYARMSLFIAAAPDFQPPNLKRCYRLSESPSKKWSSLEATTLSRIIESTAFPHVLSFLSEGDLTHSVSLVSTRFADVTAEALGNLMLVSVGCNATCWKTKQLSNESDHTDLTDHNDTSILEKASVAKSMEKGWQCLMHQFPWAQFLSDGAFKRVYKVWNNYCGSYEAISVMDVNAIDEVGNLNLVGTELAVSVILSSLAKRNICPNFVITRGVFTCQHEPPASLWGCRDECAPRGFIYDGHVQSVNDHNMPPPGNPGNYQYIRMELCDNGDVEEFIRNHPDKKLTPWDCRNLLFQMAFALHVAADRFGLKHYDVKLLNFLLQSATDPTIAVNDHPHIVLRYGVGAHIFRLRMHPSSANIAKLADYGTAVMRSDIDGQPISLGQFTTLENTPPDFLILGNAAKQGYAHDSFGLGLSMLHLFTGHCPYEEILDDVFCPDNLKGKLRTIWKQRSHNVIHSVMMDNNGMEDHTLYDTLYRFLVLFGIPDHQFDAKKNGKVWRAINSTLITPVGRRRATKGSDNDAYNRDRKKYSLSEGTDKRIADARRRLMELDGAMELLLSLVSFDPNTRATPLDVINSRLMAELIEDDSILYPEDDIVKSYTAYSTKY